MKIMEVSGGKSSFFGFGISSTVAMPPWSSSFKRAVTLILRILMGARLHLAAQAGHASVTKKLLAARCNVEASLRCKLLSSSAPSSYQHPGKGNGLTPRWRRTRFKL
jgi:hypothetical protein